MSDGQVVAVRTKALLVDPETMAVLWVNDTAAADTSSDGLSPSLPALDDAVPLAQAIGVREAIEEASASGVSQHRHADLVSTSKGAMALVVSVYRLPIGSVLVLAENTWSARKNRGPA